MINKLISPLVSKKLPLDKRFIKIAVGTFREGEAFFENFIDEDKSKEDAPDNQSIFEIGSITKVFTSLAVADLLVNQSKYSWNSFIEELSVDGIIPYFNLKKVKLSHLSKHTSGILLPEELFEGENCIENNPYSHLTESMVFSYLKTCSLSSTPGEKEAYSNLAVGLLGKILAKLDEGTFEDSVIARITNLNPKN